MLDFDLAKVIEQSRDNPVFYVQYAHARGQSVFRNAREPLSRPAGGCRGARGIRRAAPLERLDDPAELALMRKIALYPRIVEAAARPMSRTGSRSICMNWRANFTPNGRGATDAPHLRFIIQDDPQMTVARLALVQGVVTVLASGLELLGVGAPEEMR